ncbi:MAG: hypothetical protein ACK568_20445, partial [Pseudanabaena sp.]
WDGDANIVGEIALAKYLSYIHSVDTEASTNLLQETMISIRAVSTTRKIFGFLKIFIITIKLF